MYFEGFSESMYNTLCTLPLLHNIICSTLNKFIHYNIYICSNLWKINLSLPQDVKEYCHFLNIKFYIIGGEHFFKKTGIKNM